MRVVWRIVEPVFFHAEAIFAVLTVSCFLSVTPAGAVAAATSAARPLDVGPRAAFFNVAGKARRVEEPFVIQAYTLFQADAVV